MTINCTTTESIECGSTSEIINIPGSISFSYQWEMIKAKQLTPGNSIESPIFSNDTKNNEIIWRLMITRSKLYYFITNPDVKEYEIKLKFISSDASIRSLSANCNFELFSSTCSTTESDETWETPLKLELDKYSYCFPIMKHNDFTNDSLIICRINVQRMFKLFIMPKCTLADNYEGIFENHKFSDVTLCASGKEFQAHKAILVAQSPVFDAMFEHEMEETTTNRVNIPDIDGEVLQELLRFIYTGKVHNLENLARDLLASAETYGLVRLKVLCGKILCENISNENAAEVYALTHVYNLDSLKAIARKYIASNVMDVVKTEGWNFITESHPTLITEVLCEVACSK